MPPARDVTNRKKAERETVMKIDMVEVLVIVAVVGAVAVVGCGKKSDSEPTKTAEVAERTGAA